MLEALPHEPIELDDLHVPWSLLEDLVLRRAFLDGHSSTIQLAEALCVSPMVMEQAIEELRHNQLIEVQGRERRNYFIGVTETGHEQVMERMTVSRYAGAVPVPLADYSAMVRAQDEPTVTSHASVREAFADLVIGDGLLDALGPAIRSEGAIFLYGPPGTGKSAIAERLNRIHTDWVIVPHAVEVDGQVISVFDPVVHRPAPEQPDRLDRRWVLCRRPSVIVGGELIGSQLNLTYEPHAGIYLAPIQMQANNGILVIDDFGRQVLTPEQLLNRWIVPLDRSIDYLSLDYGVKFEVPCVAKIVFSTNLEPSSLADEAFFRRIRSKVLVPAIEDAAFDEILCRVAAAAGVTVTPDAPAHLRAASRERGDGDLRPYLPGAVCELVRSIADYDEIPAVLDAPMIDRIVELYFTQDPGVQAARAAAGFGGTAPAKLGEHRRPVDAAESGEAGAEAVAEGEVAPAVAAADGADDLASEIDGVVAVILLEATHRLGWATSRAEVRTIVEAVADDLARLDDAVLLGHEVLTVRVPAVEGLALRVAAPDGGDARRHVESMLDQFVGDVAHCLDLLSTPSSTGAPDAPRGVDPDTGVADHGALSRVLGRLAEDDTVVVLTLDRDTVVGDGRRALVADFAGVLTAEARGHDHIGRYSPDQFIAVLASDPGDGYDASEAFLDRLHKRWAEERPAPVDFSAGVAPARFGTDTAVLAALHAGERADPGAERPWEHASASDYA